MEEMPASVGVREAKNRFSEPTAQVNETGEPLVVTKNNEPWAIILPVDAAARERRKHVQRFMELTEKLEAADDESSWDPDVPDRELLHAERVRRFD